MNSKREIKTAILVLTSIFLFIWGYSFLKSSNIFESSKTVYVVFDDVNGVLPSALVTLNGVTIGKMESSELFDAKGRVLVTMAITSDFPISKSSKASIFEPSMIGAKQIAIYPDFTNTNVLQSGDTLQSFVDPGLMDALGDKAGPIMTKLDSTMLGANKLLGNVNEILDTQSKANLTQAIVELNQTLKNVNSITRSADRLIAGNEKKLDSAISNLDKTLAHFSAIGESLDKANLGQTVKTLETTLANVNALLLDLEKGKGTVGKLLKDEQMYTNLTNASKELEELLADLKNNPKRYVHISVFGKKSEPYQKPTK